ncbi:hypothetical protein Tco_0744185 [Tanacetum coccineum]
MMTTGLLHCITPFLPNQGAVSSLSMGSEGIPDSVCDVPLCNNPTPLEAFKEHSEIIIDSNDDSTSSDDDSYENIDYVEGITSDAEYRQLGCCFRIEPELGNLNMDVVEYILPNKDPGILGCLKPLGFVLHSPRASHPQLHFGNLIS